jgi:hypothetical protein
MGIRHSQVATGVDDPTKQISVNKWNADHVLEGELDLPVVTATPPVDGFLAIYATKLAGRTMLTQQGPSGLDTTIQPNLGGNKVSLWNPTAGATTVPGVFGMGALTALGTATSRNVTTTNFAQRMQRIGYVSAATAAAICGVRESSAKYTTGAGSGMGGFFLRARFMVSDAAAVAGARMFVGLGPAAAPTNVEPSTLLNSIGVAQLSSSNNLHIVFGGTAAGTPIDLGAGFPANLLNSEAYELTLFAASSSTNVSYQVTRLSTGAKTTGTLTTTLPISTTLLAPTLWRTNNATLLAVGLDIGLIYIETDY